MRLSLLLLLIAVSNACVNAFAEGFISKISNLFRRKHSDSPPEAPTTYRRYSSPDDDLIVNKGTCQSGEIYIEEAGRCLPVERPGGSCRYTEQCSSEEQGAFCSQNQCKCAYGMTVSGSRCVLSNPNCRQPGFIYIDELGECKRVIFPGSLGCSHSSQCSVVYKGAYCYRQTCTCPSPLSPMDSSCGHKCSSGHTYSAISSQCIPAVRPGGDCEYSSQCIAGQSATTCHKGVCRCSGGKVFSGTRCVAECPSGFAPNKLAICRPECTTIQVEYEGECYNKVPAGHKCHVTAQCSGHSICVDGICTCPSNMVLGLGVCNRKEANPRESCNDGEECTGGSFCSGGRCICPSGTKPVNAQCITPVIVGPGENCLRVDVSCDDGSICVTGVCTCIQGTILHAGKCRTHVIANPSESCGRGETCTGGSSCDRNTLRCVCPSEMIRIGAKCQPRLQSAPGFPCDNGEICIGGSYCLDDKCVCAPSQMRQGRQCVMRRQVPAGSRCTSSDICTGNSRCANEFCQCETIMVPRRGECVFPRQVRPGLRCETGDRCVGGTVCLQSMCKCQDGYTLVNERCNKVITAEPGDPCKYGKQCTQGSSCVAGTCQCPAPFIAYRGRCQQQPMSQPGMPCGSGEECIGASYCNYARGTCACPNGFIINQGTCQPPTEAMTIGSSPSSMRLPSTSTVTAASEPAMSRTSTSTRPNQSATRVNLLFRTTDRRDSFRVPQKTTSVDVHSIGKTDMHSQTVTSGQATTTTSAQSVTLGQTTSFRQPTTSSHTVSPTQPTTSSQTQRPPSSQSVAWSESTSTSRHPSSIKNQNELDRHSSTDSSPTPLDRCTTDEHCSGGTRCARGYCICPVHHIMRNGRCQRETAAPQPPISNSASRHCLASNQCPAGAQCISGICQCPSGTHLSSFGFCVPSRPGKYAEAQRRPDSTVNSQQDERIRRCPIDDSCQLPNCYCSRTIGYIPGGYNASDVPQMVILSFDDPVTDRSIKFYKSLFNGRFRNPNGCPIKGTFFISHEWNNYDQSQWLMSNGHEIAVGSMTGDALGDASMERWRGEVMGMRDALRLFSYVPSREITGVRAPHLEAGGDKQLSAMQSSGFQYDSTMSYSDGPYWPQTLDYDTAWICSQSKCPQRSHPGLWEIPITQLARKNTPGRFATLRDAQKNGDSPEDIAEMLEDNFQRHYRSNRAPFVLSIDTDFLTSLPDNGAVNALEIFITKVVERRDAYIVTASQALRWLQLPTRLQKLHNFNAWKCPIRPTDHVLPCENPSVCAFTCDRGEAHAFRVCGSCPRAYPKLGDPTGSGNVTMLN